MNIILSQAGKTQVNKEHYMFDKYLTLARWNSYYHQIMESVAFSPKTILIVGAGDNIVGNMIATMLQSKVYTFDFDENLQPDFCGNVMNIQQILKGVKRFDLVLCCQVLEHIPFSSFENVIQQLSTIADNVIISLPHTPIRIAMSVDFPFIGSKKINFDIHQFFRSYKFNGEHYWEVGHKGYSKNKIKKVLEKYMKIKKQFVAINNHFHLFYCLTSKNNNYAE